MSLSNPVTSVVTRRRVIETAQALARTNTISVEAYEAHLTAVGQQFSEDFGVDCKVIISVDKAALVKKVDEAEKAGQ
jgi:hypothetical protein